jgi:VCBS repeat-containing protein
MADELEVLEKQQLSAQRSLNDLTDQLTLADHLVYKKYLTELQNYGMVELSQQMLDVQDPAQCIQLFQLQKLTLKKGEDMFQKLSTVYYSSMAQGCSLAVMIDVSDAGSGANIYLGVREDPAQKSMENRKLDISGKTLQKVLLSNFPGSEVTAVSQKEEDKLLNDPAEGAFGEYQEAVASVSCVAALRDKSKTEDKAFVQGIERFMDAMDGEVYTALFLAEPVSAETQAEIRSGYENLYSSLSPFRKSTWSYSENQSTAVMESLCSGTSHTISDTVSTTTTDGTSQSSSVTDGTQKTKGVSGGINGGVGSSSGTSVTKVSPVAGGIAGILGLGGAVASVAIPVAGAVIGPLLGTAGRAIGGMAPSRTAFNSIARNIGGSMGVNDSWGTSHSATEQTGTSHSTSDGTSHGTSDTISQQESHGTTDTRGMGRTQQVELCNKSVEELLERIENQLKRAKESEDYGCYKCAAYFLSSTPSTAILAANTYRALMVGEGSSVESGAVNVWQNDEAQVAQLREYLKRFMHPVFARPLWAGAPDSLLYTPATLVSGRELPMHLGLPTRSVHGLPIIEHAEFGRNVPDETVPDADKMELGKIYHMGREEKADLILNRQALTAHTFITGSTGSGKSNTVYELLRQLDAGGVNFMVIEPAKGEYKNVFGGREDVHVFGTNPKITELLRINPFRFPEEIHVLEHIDRLIEIFSVCWPMYAAMPAVLKNAMLQAYEVCGWNLETSENEYNKDLFPTFQDLLTELVDVIEHSAYDKEVKNNYRGSLETRVRSLANGLNGQIFSADEIPEKQLFDENTIVDLSRVGSLESKSLIMGILIMRLNEYRMTSCTEMNNPLKHVTVLEEAHNILRRTSTEQTEEGSNVAGKSVEMIANAIAEMRTYGEGFVIADQSPGAVDISAIRNTNTKIIMRLPDEQDCQLAGKAAALKDDQLDEIARLPKGVAVIYQNNWTEPVLCKINKFEGVEKRYQYKTCATDRKAEMMSAILLKNLLKKEKGEPLDLNLRQLQDLLLKISMPSKTKIAALKALQKNGRCRQKDIQSVVYKLVCTPTVEEELTRTESIEEWRDEIAYFGSTELADLDEEMLNEVAELILLEQIKCYDWPKTYLEQWQEFRKKEMLV